MEYCRILAIALSLLAAQAQPIQPPAATFKGVIKAVDGGKVQVELPDGNLMEFRATRKSKIQVSGKAAKWKDLAPGQTVEIEGRRVLREIEIVSAVVATKKKSSPEP
jgi:hypothetical protein